MPTCLFLQFAIATLISSWVFGADQAGPLMRADAAAAVSTTAVDFTAALLSDDAKRLRLQLEPGIFQQEVEGHLGILALQGRPPAGGAVLAMVVARRSEEVQSISHWLGDCGPTWIVTVGVCIGDAQRRYEVWIRKATGKVSGFTDVTSAQVGDPVAVWESFAPEVMRWARSSR